MVRQKGWEWRVEGLDCPTCAATLEKACATVPGVREATASAVTGRLRVMADPATFDPGRLAVAARRVGHPLILDQQQPGRLGSRTTILGAGLLLLGFAVESAGGPAAVPYLAAALTGVVTLLPRAWQAVRLRSITVDVLMATAMSGAIALGDWREAAILGVLFAVARWIERSSFERTGRAVESLLELAPRVARVERDLTVVEVPVEEVKVGARVQVRPGDLVPLDGIIVAGGGDVDQSAVTGESLPVAKTVGDLVYAATLSIDGALAVEVTRPAEDSTIARVVKLVEEAALAPSPTARAVDRFAAWYTPAVVGLAALVAVVPMAWGRPFGDGLYRGLVLLVLGCPCALVIATPVAILSALTNLARRGVLVHGGGSIEALAQVRGAAFDKTGTLTTGRPRLEAIRVVGHGDEDELLAVAAALEADSSHPLGLALREAAEQRGLSLPAAGHHRARPGLGVSGEVGGVPHHLGNTRLMAVVGVDVAAAEQAAVELGRRGWSTMVLAAERPLAVFGLADQVRPEAAETISALRSAGIQHLAMLTGDQGATARAVAELVGIQDVRAELLPDAKQAAVAELGRAHGGVMMVGDGINDAPALASATVGIALGAAGSDIAIESADIALLGDDLRMLPALRATAVRARRIVVANIVVACLVRLVLLPLAVAGQAGLGWAIAGDMGSSLLVTLNSMRLLREVGRRDA